jgi:transcriptional regulator with XRE-family HTH domain
MHPEPASRVARAHAPDEIDLRCRPSHRARQLSTLLHMLVQLRRGVGLDQTSLAGRLGITQSEVSKFERGERALDVLRLRDWLAALEVEFSTFTDALDQALRRQESVAGRDERRTAWTIAAQPDARAERASAPGISG